MKRLKYLLLIIFMIPTIVFASEIKQDTIDVSIKEDGSVSVVETWEVPRQNSNEFQKDFFNLKDASIENFTITSENVSINKVKKVKSDQLNTYSEIIRDKSISYKMILDTSSEKTYTITYDVKGMIKQYSDNIYGIDFTFIGINYHMKISKIHITVSSEIPFYENNTALYGIGKNLSLTLEDGKILLNSYNFNGRYNVRLLTKFTGVEYKNSVKVNKTFDQAYKSIKNENIYLSYIFNVLSKSIVIILIIVGILIILMVISRFIAKKKSNNEYKYITTIMNKTLTPYDEVDYYKDIPMADLYKAAFISSYFNISKNKSDLVGAYLLTWLYQGVIDVSTTGLKPYIKLNVDNINSEKQLDKDLFLMLKEASIHGKIDGSKLDRFSANHYVRVMTWFNSGVANVISNEGKKESVKKINKVGKPLLELQESIINDGNKLLGLKKYLLNFNQVPRETELTESTYKFLLIYAELFGIGEMVAKEILRKNPDNIYAKGLLELEKVRFIYKHFYSKAFEIYINNKNAITDESAFTLDFDENISKKGIKL